MTKIPGPVPNIGLQRTARLRLAAAEAGSFGDVSRTDIVDTVRAGK
jgi:hypothetical protein